MPRPRLRQADLFQEPRPALTLPASVPPGALCVSGANIWPRHEWRGLSWACERCGFVLVLAKFVDGKARK